MSREDKTEEQSLINQVLNGDKNSYRLVVDRYSPMVFHVVRRFVKDEDEVKELAQQVFVKAYEKLESFNMNAKFSSWLYSITMNHCRDYAKNIRRSNKRMSELEPGFTDILLQEKKTPYLNLELKEWKQLLAKALERLSVDYSEPFLFKYRDGMSYEAISEKTGVSVSALKVRVHRARKELRTMLAKQHQL